MEVVAKIAKGDVEPNYNWVVIGWVGILLCFFIPFPYKMLPLVLAFWSFFRVYNYKELF